MLNHTTVTPPVRQFVSRIANKLQRLALLKPEAMARIEAAIDAELHDIAGPARECKNAETEATAFDLIGGVSVW